jgi:hypothetical protein
MNEPEPEESEAPDSRRGALLGLAIVLALVVGGLILVKALRHNAQIQDCVLSGRTNCAPIDTSSESHAN